MDTFSMSSKERRRLIQFSRVKDKLISVAEAARELGISERQGRRWQKRYLEHGEQGLVHGLRGKVSNASQESLRARVLALYRGQYMGTNASHASDLLAEFNKVKVGRRTLWRWLKAEKLVFKERRVPEHRIRREPCACVGEMAQMDGSTHRWLGEAGGMLVLFVMVDDATGRAFARFYESEDTASAFDVFGRYVRAYGVPRCLYVDHDSIYVVNDAPKKLECKQAGLPMPLTQFGCAMEELGVSIICAHSPQAKGRVERTHGVLQDRLLKELAIFKIKSLAAANVFLEKYLRRHNQRFNRVAAQGSNMHGRVPKGLKLEDVLCLKAERTVGRDWCVSYEGRVLQIDRKHAGQSLAGRKIQVLEHADGRLTLRYQGKALGWRDAAATAPGRGPSCPLLAPLCQKTAVANATVLPSPAPALGKAGKGQTSRSAGRSKDAWRPGPSHPWNTPISACRNPVLVA